MWKRSKRKTESKLNRNSSKGELKKKDTLNRLNDPKKCRLERLRSTCCRDFPVGRHAVTRDAAHRLLPKLFTTYPFHGIEKEKQPLYHLVWLEKKRSFCV